MLVWGFLTNTMFLKKSLKIRNQSVCSKMALEPKSAEDATKTKKGELIEP
jgi:hypothetical protein